MRILLVVHQYLPDHVGGTEVYTWSLAEALSALGHHVTVFYPDQHIRQDEQAQQDSHMTWRAPVSPPCKVFGPAALFWRTFRNPGIEKSYTRALAAVQPDIVHIQHLQNVSARLLALSAKRPTLVTLHDYWFRCATGQLVQVDGSFCAGPSMSCASCALARTDARIPALLRPLVSIPLWYRNVYLTWMLTYVDRFIVPSGYVRQQFLDWGFDEGRITIVPHGVDPRRLTKHASVSSGATPAGGLRFGYLGALAPGKGLHVLLQAFEGLPAKATLAVYGDPSAFPDYVADLHNLARHPGIQFMGAVPAEYVGDALRDFDYLVIPSLSHETYALVVDEAHALGVPAIASRVGALSRIRDGVDGRLFEPGDIQGLQTILEELIAKPELRRQYAAAIPPVPTIDKQTALIERLYRDTIDQRTYR